MLNKNESKKKLILLILLVFIPLISAIDSQLSIPCGIDQQLIISCNPSNLQIIFVSREYISPIVTLISPADGSEDTDSIVNFFYTTRDSSRIDNCSLYFDNVLKTTDTSITKDTTQSFTIQDPPEKNNLAWFIECRDMWNNVGNSATWNLDTLLGSGVPEGGGGGGGAGNFLRKEDIDSRLCNLTTLSLNFSVLEIQDKYFNLTGNLTSSNLVRFYIDNWQNICNITEFKPLPLPFLITPEGKIDLSFLIWFVLLVGFFGLMILLIIKKKKVLLLLMGEEEKKSRKVV